MRKYIVIILLLLSSIYLSFRYLSKILADKRAYVYEASKVFYLLQKRPIILNDISDFVFEEYFSILSKSALAYRYDFDEDSINIQIGGRSFSYPYELREEKVIETIVFEQVIREVKVYEEVSDHEQGVQEKAEYEEEYFHLKQDHFEFVKGTDISKIIEVIQASIDTNQSVSVDYSLLNPNQIGQYSLFLHKDDEKIEIFVEIV